MSWSYTINGVVQDFELPADLIERMAATNLAYPADMFLALEIAKRAGFASAVCTGFRTPSPYGTDEAVMISVQGTAAPVDFNDMIKDMIKTPDCIHEVRNGICIHCEQRMDVLGGSS